MPIVALPDGREVDFPDGVTESDMTSALQRDFPDYFKPAIPQLSEQEVRDVTGAASSSMDLAAQNFIRNQELGVSDGRAAPTPGPVEFLSEMAATPGRLAFLGAADLVSAIDPEHGKEYGGNIKALLTGNPDEPLPVQQFIGSAAKTNPKLATAANLAKALPELASMVAANPPGAAGRLLAAGFTADMIANANPLFQEYATEINLPKEQQDAGKIAELEAGIIQTFGFAPLAGARSAVNKSPAATAGRMLANEVRKADLKTLPENTGPTVAREVGQAEISSEAVVKAFNENARIGNTQTAKALAEGESATTSSVKEQGTAGAGELPRAKETAAQSPDLINREARVTEPPTPSPESAVAALPTEPASPAKTTVTPEVTDAKREFVGMGGAVPAEFQPVKPFVTKNTFEQITKESKELGLPEMKEHEVFPNREAKRQAEKILDDDPQAVERMLDRLEKDPLQTLDPVEHSMTVLERAKVLNSYFAELKKWRDATESGQSEVAAGASANADIFKKQLDRINTAVGEGGTGTAAGRALQGRKIGIREDMSLEMMTLKAMKSAGRKLTHDEMGEIQKLNEKNIELQKQLDEALARERSGATETDVQLGVTDAITAARKQKAKGATKARDLEGEQKAVVDHLKETFIENGDIAGPSRHPKENQRVI